MLYAIIDIGSSIMKYKIFEKKENIIEPIIINDRTTGLISYREENKLTDEGIHVLITTLKEFINYSQKLHVNKNYFFATASLRNISNSKEVLSRVKRELNIDIKILSGKEEAESSFKSLKFIDMPTNEGIFVDIGGGSSEVTIFENNTPLEQESIPTGVLTIYHNEISSLLPTKEEEEKIIEQIKEKIEEVNFSDYSYEYLYGIGKTFVTIKRLCEHLKIKEDEGNILDIEQINYILSKFSSNTKENFKPLLQVDSERVHTVIPSLLIVKSLSKKFNFKKIYVCDVTLQDGLILSIE